MKKWILSVLILSVLCAGCAQGSKQGQQQNKNANPHPRMHQIQMSQKKAPETDGSETVAGKSTIDVVGFLEPMDPKKSIADVQSVGNNLTYVAFFSYRVKENGDLIPLNDGPALQEVKRRKMIPMLVITNFADGNFSPDIAHKIFTDPNASRRLIDNVLHVMKTKGYKALNIDFEHIREKDKNLYNGFLQTIIPTVKKQGFLVSTALAPKTSGEQRGPWHGAHDYKAHGQLADFVILMTYEWGWSGGPPMAVAPIPQVRKVLDYATKVIPPEKIVLGAPLYGYDWTLPYKKGGPWAKRIAPAEAKELAQKVGAQVKFDNEAQAPHFNYTDGQGKKHVVWFENEQSAQAKFNLVKEYRLRGIGYWVLGEPFPSNWSLLSDNFYIRKTLLRTK